MIPTCPRVREQKEKGITLNADALSRRRLCIGAIVYNEGPYLLEWLAFHLNQGVEHFYIADNHSSDETTVILEALALRGRVTRLFQPRVAQGNMQLEAYRRILERVDPARDLVAFLDADEYLLPTDSGTTAAALVCSMFADPAVGAVAVNWRVFGSSGRIAPGVGLVTERFLQAGDQGREVNRHVKSIVDPAAVTVMQAHIGRLKPPRVYVDAQGRRYDYTRSGGFASEVAPVWSPLVVHHYVIKSFEEFMTRKRGRGRATQGAAVCRDEQFFHHHDLNDYSCEAMRAHWPATRERRMALMAEVETVRASRTATVIGLPCRGAVTVAAPGDIPAPVARCVVDGLREQDLPVTRVPAPLLSRDRWRPGRVVRYRVRLPTEPHGRLRFVGGVPWDEPV